MLWAKSSTPGTHRSYASITGVTYAECCVRSAIDFNALSCGNIAPPLIDWPLPGFRFRCEIKKTTIATVRGKDPSLCVAVIF